MKLKPNQFKFNPIIYIAKYHEIESNPSLIKQFEEEMSPNEFLRFKEFRKDMNSKLYDEAVHYFKNGTLDES